MGVDAADAGVRGRKAEIRREVRRRLHGLGPRERAFEEELVNAAILSDPEWAAARTVLLYRHREPEFGVVSLANAAWRLGKRVVFPRVADRLAGLLELRQVGGWSDLEVGTYGIQEPTERAPEVAPGELDLAVVPGVAFTAGGRRLGQGGGFYDRLLPRLEAPAWGVCFDAQVVEDLPAAPHDAPVDRVWCLSELDLGV